MNLRVFCDFRWVVLFSLLLGTQAFAFHFKSNKNSEPHALQLPRDVMNMILSYIHDDSLIQSGYVSHEWSRRAQDSDEYPLLRAQRILLNRLGAIPSVKDKDVTVKIRKALSQVHGKVTKKKNEPNLPFDDLRSLTMGLRTTHLGKRADPLIERVMVNAKQYSTKDQKSFAEMREGLRQELMILGDLADISSLELAHKILDRLIEISRGLYSEVKYSFLRALLNLAQNPEADEKFLEKFDYTIRHMGTNPTIWFDFYFMSPVKVYLLKQPQLPRAVYLSILKDFEDGRFIWSDFSGSTGNPYIGEDEYTQFFHHLDNKNLSGYISNRDVILKGFASQTGSSFSFKDTQGLFSENTGPDVYYKLSKNSQLTYENQRTLYLIENEAIKSAILAGLGANPNIDPALLQEILEWSLQNENYFVLRNIASNINIPANDVIRVWKWSLERKNTSNEALAIWVALARNSSLSQELQEKLLAELKNTYDGKENLKFNYSQFNSFNPDLEWGVLMVGEGRKDDCMATHPFGMTSNERGGLLARSLIELTRNPNATVSTLQKILSFGPNWLGRKLILPFIVSHPNSSREMRTTILNEARKNRELYLISAAAAWSPRRAH